MKNYHHVVITAGISVFSRFNQYYQWTEKQNIFEFERTNPKPIGDKPAKQTLEQWETICQQVDYSFAKENPKSVSAEYSLLYALKEAQRLTDQPKVVLIHSDTFGGNAAITLVSRLLEHQFKATVIKRPVAEMDTEDRTQLRASLGGFMEIVARELSRGHPSYTSFAPVGGYKVMTSLGYLAGAYMGFPTAYLHEDGQILHEIPAVPIKISADELRIIGHLVKLAWHDVDYDQLSDEYAKYVDEKYSYLFEQIAEDEKRLVTLNAFGRFIASRPENLSFVTPKMKLSSQVQIKELFNNNDVKEFVVNQLQELLKKLATPNDYMGELHHEKTFSKLREANFALYKGASNGQLIFRVAYQFDKTNQILYLNKIWLDHDKYDKATDNQVGFFDNVSEIEWTDWTDEWQRLFNPNP